MESNQIKLPIFLPYALTSGGEPSLKSTLTHVGFFTVITALQLLLAAPRPPLGVIYPCPSPSEVESL